MRYIELPLLIILFLLLWFPSKSIVKDTLLSVIPVVGLYILYDIFYHFLARSPRVSDIYNATTLSDFSLTMSFGSVMIFLFIISPIIYLIYQFKRDNKKQTFYAIFIAKFFILIGLFYYLGTNHFNNYISKKFDYYDWSQSKTIKKNGRFTSFIYYGIVSKHSKEKLAKYKEKDIDVNKLLFDDIKLTNRPNIYIIMLESFIDPRLIKDATFDISPLAEGLKKYLPNGEFSYVTSPVYGGGTSQAEFEVLTGVRALAKVHSIEFNTLEGGQISGFTDALKKNGYNTHATIATYSGYYNSKEAYKSIGFDEIVFLEESDWFQKIDNDEKIFDGDVYSYNIKKLKSTIFKKPYLHYTLGMYGHFPYDRNLEKRADVISTSHKDKRVGRIANQFYYRTKALALYIDTILEFDPKSIIYVTSDHLPPLLTSEVKYTKPQTENIAFLVVNKKAVDVSGQNYYQIPRVIWRLISGNNFELDAIDIKIEEDIYFKVLSESLE